MKKLALLVALLLPVSVYALDSKPIIVEELTKTTKSWDGSELPSYKKGQPEITILRITVQPNVELPWHTHPIINAGIMVKGKLTVITKSGEKHELVAGDTIVEVTGKIHRGINNGNEPAEIIVFYAGIVKTPLTIKVE
ncbi:MAG: cupin domain-containing protein [Gammaproteobacteria bacterium]|nr:cupin domain-containing protein [Gammaproteobacteria bacterium]MCP4088715.1 cupin domain-containing protein [Gammaproteobacteria bacterium]MCP4275242.1 cupin domain-containing protein [Gammaproteobacteria bacterium]MCP4830748.1 cupin domain-containing protein [Gammaproteobacteria bacterium]MCP4929537.1 cupin domain-containing protein [Gammaproteobacteria bacterium]